MLLIDVLKPLHKVRLDAALVVAFKPQIRQDTRFVTHLQPATEAVMQFTL